ncbi:MAG: 3-keto-disaccharide hydrolase [Thermoguttaceae bacterium]
MAHLSGILRRLALVLLTLGMIGPTATGAADPAVEPDADFALLGEFRGPISREVNKYEPLALQVRPIGGGNFEAIQYEGGLPGEKEFRGKPMSFVGRRSGDFLVLSGGPWILVVEKDHCLILDRTGQKIGRLERVERASPTMGAQPPKDAVVLFDGTGTDQFSVGEMTPDGLLMQGADIKPMFQDFNLHLEFFLPYMPASLDQGRSNSGIYVQSRYEVQILDSFASEPVFNGCGSLYRFRAPDLNMCLPPRQWQTYDIIFTAPRWAADGTKLRNARITVWLNGVKVHNEAELADKTGAGKPEEPLLLPTRLQDHGNPVRYRNIWVIDRGLSGNVKFPVYPPKPQPKKAEPKPEPKPEPKAEAKPEPKAEPKAAVKPEVKAEPKAEVKAEAKKAEPKPEVKPEPKKAEPKPETKPEPKAEAKPEPKAEVKPEVKAEPKAEVKAEAKKAEPKPEVKPEPNPEPKKAEPKLETKPEPKPEAKADAKPQPAPEVKPE